MGDAKRTKRCPQTLEYSPDDLETHIAQQRAKLMDDRLKAHALREAATRLEEEAEGLMLRWQVRPRADLLLRAKTLRREADVRFSLEREYEFEKQANMYRKRYYNVRLPTRCGDGGSGGSRSSSFAKSKEVAVQRSVLVDEYLTDIQKAPAKVAMSTRDTCPRCPGGDSMLLLCAARSIMTCPKCGYSVTYMDSTSSYTAFDEMVEFSQYSYKRVNHYMQWVTLIQGKEGHVVPDSVMNAVMADLYERQHVRCAHDITPKRVRDTLRKLRLKRAYDHVTQITARLSGVRPPRIPAHVEEQLKNMFLQMQLPFQKYAPASRTNFLSYSYVLYRCFEILGLTHMLDSICLLKSRDKLEANDSIFRRIAEDLNWPVGALPPACMTTR